MQQDSNDKERDKGKIAEDDPPKFSREANPF